MVAAKRTILCVDDEADIVSSLYDTFMDKYDVKTATGGEEALEIFKKEDVVLVITDQRMPKMEGTELLAKIDALKPKCKRILLTGYADVNAAIDAINKGRVDKYISKPWDDEDLSRTVDELVRRYENEASFAKLIEDARSLKESVKRVRGNLDMFERFVKYYRCGICLVSDEGKIEFMNNAGLETLQYSDLTQVQGKNVEEVFLLTHIVKSFLQEKYTMTKKQAFETVQVKTGDGSALSLPVSLTFVMATGEVRMNGIVF